MEGTPFGRYRLIELLGRGGMGEVWRAFDLETKRIVAVKLLPASAADDPVFEARFRREAEAAAGLNDPHVVPIHHFGEIDGRLYVDMRLIEGRDLEAVLAEAALQPARAVSIVEQIASALQAAHRIGLVHRDVKPSNILLTEDDFAYLIDFGIARTADDKPLTSTGMVIGTWAYMAPERFTTGATDPRGDVYALACVLYQCLKGQQPFPGNSLEQQFAGHMASSPPKPSLAGSHVPLGMDDVVAEGMAKDPAHRYASTVELARAARKASAISAQRATTMRAEQVYTQRPDLVSTSAPTRHRSLHLDPSLRREPLTATSKPPRTRWRIKPVVVPLAVIAVTAAIAWTVNSVNPGRWRSATLNDAGRISVDAPDAALATAWEVAATRPSVLKIRGEAPSCQKVFEGSGFVVAPNKVMSSAHVVAGAETVRVEDGDHTYDAHVVSYDPNEDISILEVPDLPAVPLAFDLHYARQGTDAIALGYPGGGDFTATPARIRETVSLSGQDIYRTTTVDREAYAVMGTVRRGNSGGPLIDRQGKVLGVVFRAAVDDGDTGVVMTAEQVAGQMAKVGNTERVATGACSADDGGEGAAQAPDSVPANYAPYTGPGPNPGGSPIVNVPPSTPGG